MLRGKRGSAVLAALAALMLSCVLAPAGAADIEDEQWAASESYQNAYHGLVVEGVSSTIGGNSNLFSMLLAMHDSKGYFTWDRYVCGSTSDANCTPESGVSYYDFIAILPVCANDADADCIAGLSAITPEGKEVQARFQSYTVADHANHYVPDAQHGIPNDAMPSIWTIPDAPHAFGDQFVLNVSLSGRNFLDGSNFTASSLSASLQAVSVKPGGAGSMGIPQCASWLDPSTGHYNNACSTALMPLDASYRCSNVLDSKTGAENDCLMPHALPANFRFKVQLRLAHEPVGWLHGRITDPSITISKLPSGATALQVEAAPATVPTVYYGGSWSELPASLQEFWRQCEAQAFTCGGAGKASTVLEERIGLMRMPSFGLGALTAVKTIAPLIGDKAVATPSAWTFNTLPSNQLNGANACLRDGAGVKGIVTTNSTAYSEGPPEFLDEMLSYKVAAPHYDAKGKVFHGDYSLVIRSDVARCLYKFSKAPISASVSVVSDSGSNEVATTATTERDGWLYMRASNFTFSSPTVKVKLTQAAPAPTASASAAPSASATAKATTTVAKKVTITCVKGKTVKKVTAVKPTCPAGYKRKA